jgi:hypothetical protein
MVKRVTYIEALQKMNDDSFWDGIYDNVERLYLMEPLVHAMEAFAISEQALALAKEVIISLVEGKSGAKAMAELFLKEISDEQEKIQGE